MNTITLGGKERIVKEPVFRQLRLIIPLYQALGEAATTAAAHALIKQLLAVFFEHDPPRFVSQDELTAFVQAVPRLVGLTLGDPKAPASGTDDWGTIYAHLAAYFSWEYDYIDNHMTMTRLKELSPYLKNNPPTHQLVAAFLGYEHRASEDKVKQFFQSIASKARH